MSSRANQHRQPKFAEHPAGSDSAALPDWATEARPAIKRQAPKSNATPSSPRFSAAPKPQLLTVDQAAERLVVSSRTVRRMINDGRLKHVQIGRAVRVSEAVLAAFILGEKL